MIANKKMREEAIRRIRLLDMHPNVEDNFLCGILQCSTNGRVQLGGLVSDVAVLHDLSDEYQKLVKDFEEKHGYLVYHLIESHTEIGTLLSFLYICDREDEWANDYENLKEGYPFVYVANLDIEYFSEFGRIGVKPCHGGLFRTC